MQEARSRDVSVPVKRQPLAERILALTTPDVSSGWIAQRLGTDAAYVRAVWRRGGLDKRPMGINPPMCQQRRRRRTEAHA